MKIFCWVFIRWEAERKPCSYLYLIKKWRRAIPQSICISFLSFHTPAHGEHHSVLLVRQQTLPFCFLESLTDMQSCLHFYKSFTWGRLYICKGRCVSQGQQSQGHILECSGKTEVQQLDVSKMLIKGKISWATLSTSLRTGVNVGCRLRIPDQHLGPKGTTHRPWTICAGTPVNAHRDFRCLKTENISYKISPTNCQRLFHTRAQCGARQPPSTLEMTKMEQGKLSPFLPIS